MLKFLKNKLLNEDGAMDKIVLTLLLVGIGITGLIGLSTWSKNSKKQLELQAATNIERILLQDAPAATDDLYLLQHNEIPAVEDEEIFLED